MTTNTQKMGIFVLVRGQAIQSTRDSWSVALTAPMKRGLKAEEKNKGEGDDNSCTHCPDEKGTESRKAVWVGEVLM